ncbi:uncharacterized protein [Hemitrygon akajei]|uniref:uncharacterized protein n=1 Tax=Hemitrygon akajei TaxID=2704970 RepID=UPI003BF9E9A0
MLKMVTRKYGHFPTFAASAPFQEPELSAGLVSDIQQMISVRAGDIGKREDHLTSTYTELNIRKVVPLINIQTDGPDPTYSQLKFRQNELLISKDEDPPLASGPRETPVTAQAGQHTQHPKDNIANGPYRQICLLCLVTSVVVGTVAGLSIYVSQIRHSLITCDRDHQELRGQENKLLVLENENSLLNTHLSDLNKTQTDLRQKITDLEIKYRTLTEEKAQICQLLTSRKEQACSQDWIRNEGRCYFISTLETSYDRAERYCSNFDARLLEINSKEEQNVVSNGLGRQYRRYWIGKCGGGEEASSLMVKDFTGTSVCGTCDSHEWRYLCNRQHRFICEKSAHLCTDIPEKIQDLCQQSVGPT